MKKAILGAAFFAALAAMPAMAANEFAGKTVTATYAGLASGVLAWDGSDYSSNVTTVGSELEFFTSDTKFFIDLDANGLVTIWNNDELGATVPAGAAVFNLDFSGLTDSLTSFSAVDLSAASASSSFLSVINSHSVSIDLSKLSWNTQYGSVTTQLTVAAVPEPGTWAMLLAGLGSLALIRRRKSA